MGSFIVHENGILVEQNPLLLNRLKSFRVFRETFELGEEYFKNLLSEGELDYFTAGETLIDAKEPGKYLYLLVKGELSVLVTGLSGVEKEEVAHLKSGEFFGEMALLTNDISSAEVNVSGKVKEAITFKIAFSKLLSLSDHSDLSLETKIVLYRQIVHLLRWRNDLYRIRFPYNILACKPYTVAPFSGVNWSTEELHSLHNQSRALAVRLKELNASLGS